MRSLRKESAFGPAWQVLEAVLFTAALIGAGFAMLCAGGCGDDKAPPAPELPECQVLRLANMQACEGGPVDGDGRALYRCSGFVANDNCLATYYCDQGAAGTVGVRCTSACEVAP